MTDSTLQTRYHELGADLSPQGVRYTVWAPEKAKVTAHIRSLGSKNEHVLLLEKKENGYFTALDPAGSAGDLYTFTVDDQQGLPDLASRYQPRGLSGPSMVVDPTAYIWKTSQWKRSAPREQVIYELHVGAFTREGTYRAAAEHLDHLVGLGITTVELMPLAQCTGSRNWGYDGVLLFTPAQAYGTPDDLRAFVDACHGHGLSVILDVVYNHIGAIGDSTHNYSQYFAHPDNTGAWGKHYNLDGENSGPVRHFLLQNVAYWLDEFRFDGFRFDATQAIRDNSRTHFMVEVAGLIHARRGIAIAEDDRKSTEIFKPVRDGGWQIDAVWADDFHHTMHVSQTHENHSYLANYTGSLDEIADTLRHGWRDHGKVSSKSDKPLVTASQHLSPACFVHCISNHDQVGNRPFGERLNHLISPAAYRALSLFFCLTPYTPLIFMGQEWSATSPFLFFSDHPGDFGRLVAEGRKREFQFDAKKHHEPLPNCQDESTFRQSKLRWEEMRESTHRDTFLLYREALRLRHEVFAGQNPMREFWTVETPPRGVSLLYQWPASNLEVTLWMSGDAVPKSNSAKKVLLRSGEKRFGGNPLENGPETIVTSRD